MQGAKDLSEFNRFRVSTTAIIVLIAGTCMFWGMLQSYSPNYFLYNDNVTMYLSYIKFNWENILGRHEIPFINFHEYLGENYLGQGQTSVFSPSLYMAVALSRLFTGDYYWTVDFLMLIHLIVGGIGFYVLMRYLQISSVISTLSSLLWLTFPYLVIISKAWFSVINIFPFLPWNLLLLVMLYEAPRFSTAFLLGFVKAVSFYAGNAQFVYMMGYTEIFFLLSYFAVSSMSFKPTGPGFKRPDFNSTAAWEKFKGFTPFYILSFITFICLAAPQILPLLATTGDSAFRAEGYSIQRLLNYSVNPLVFVKSQFGHFEIPIFYNGKSVMYFVGLPLLSVFTLFAGRVREHIYIKRSAAFLIVASLSFLLGTAMYKYFLFFPFFDNFRWIFKHFLFFLFFFSITIALLSDSFLADSRAVWKKTFVYLMFIISIITNVYFNVHYGSGSNSALGPWRIEAGEPDPFKGIIQKTAGRTMTIGFFDDFGKGKVLNHSNSFQYLMFGFPTFWGYYHFNGYNPLVTAENFHAGLGNYQFSFQFINYVDVTRMDEYLDYFSRWAGRYLITYNQQNVREELARYPQLALIYKSDKTLLFENTGAYPMAYLKSDIFRPVEYEIGINAITIRPGNREKDTLVINVVPLKGYSYRLGADLNYVDIEIDRVPIKDRDACFSDGKKIVPCEPGRWTRKDYLQEVNQKIKPLSIEIPAGTETVELRYRDQSFFYGLYISIAYLLTAGAGTVINRIFRKRLP
ncbi:MAG: hypothetical protein AMK70_09175 [Nitrospira bacterium SG8_35_1]|nr:MAG: hypothetical protein AMK70_09175 [Nitrospira bacterium SG8_35_1]